MPSGRNLLLAAIVCRHLSVYVCGKAKEFIEM